MPELRTDVFSGREVLVASERSLRPNDFTAAASEVVDQHAEQQRQRQNLKRRQKRRDDCPFCFGREDRMTEPVAETLDAEGRWLVRAIPNKYPAAAGEVGRHEVIVESPEHHEDVTQLSSSQFACVLRMQRNRLQQWLADGRYEYVALFKNAGQAAGASLEHVHSQLVALPLVPRDVRTELAGAQREYGQHGTCGYCHLIKQTLATDDPPRLVEQSEHFISLCPYAARMPYETWVLPREHGSRFEAISDSHCEALAEQLLRLIRAVRQQFAQPAYHLILRTSPRPYDQAASFHWHWQLVPRSSQIAGLELGSGVFINSVPPEQAAERLRDVIAE